MIENVKNWFLQSYLILTSFSLKMLPAKNSQFEQESWILKQKQNNLRVAIEVFYNENLEKPKSYVTSPQAEGKV